MATDEELMRLARKRAEDKIGFYVHFSIYLSINALLVLIWWFTGDGFRGSSFRSVFGESASLHTLSVSL